ncbi:unnamed protein product [Microthlaspi erraticum]|uniref:RNase H type-1 domain-containing protein n=1 Tax=Microthlaspi erraticum TaxID=1685480 RepID=A0A6D2JUH6_9BRAS|nr:unnamed protein product [Microthlaspi erraticum]
MLSFITKVKRPLVNKRLIKRVGSGNSISVWEDPWIPASCPRPATGHGANFYPHLRVSELMTPGTSTWNLPLLNQLFDSEDVPIILGIPTSRTGARLQSRGLQIDPQCVRCGMAPETVNHMLFECPPALQRGGTAQERQEVTLVLEGNPAELSARGEICQIDGSWKATDSRAGLGWYNFNTETGEKLMGTCNLRRGISPLQAELEALVWAMQCMLRQRKLTIVFETDCSDVVKMVSKPEDGQLLQQY